MARALRRLLPLVAAAAAAVAGAWTPAAHASPVPWCGSGEPTTDLSDAVSAFEWHVVYAMTDGAPDRFADYAPHIVGDVNAMETWWVGQDPTRRPRFDLLDTPCGTEAGRIDISLLKVPSGDNTFDALVADAAAAGFDNADKGYLLYFDGTPHPGEEFGLCGQGRPDNTSFAYTVVFLQTCGLSTDDDTRALVATHEMTHGMGAVPDQAPHVCNGGHVCDSSVDLMKAVIGDGDTLATLQLDVGRDDYYGHAGTWWNVRDSGLLYDLDQSLAPAPEIAGLTATSVGSSVLVSWGITPAGGSVTYRIYDADGRLTSSDLGQEGTTIAASGQIGDTLTWTIRSYNDFGFLSHPATIHFKVGYGIVDASGALLTDTVKPGRVGTVRVAKRTKTAVVLRWAAVGDPIGLRGYRVSAPGMAPLVVKTPTATLPLARVRGKTVSVAAVDEAGNTGRPAAVRVGR